MNVAITCLFTSIPNPLCPGCDNYRSDPMLLRDWVSSITEGHAVILHDGWIGREEQGLLRHWSPQTRVTTKTVTVTDENLFFQRWRHLWDWLMANSDTEFVWMTDGSDVRMLNPPWVHMRPSTLYVGSEEDVVSNRWIVDNHPSIRDLAKRAGKQPLANAGLLGGDRITVLHFLDRLIWRLEGSDGDLTDMAAFNLTLYEDWDGYVETGYPIHTKFGAWAKKDRQALWAHK